MTHEIALSILDTDSAVDSLRQEIPQLRTVSDALAVAAVAEAFARRWQELSDAARSRADHMGGLNEQPTV